MAAATAARAAVVKGVKKMGFPYETLDPFLFCVWHRDKYPAGNGNMRVPGNMGNGMDFDWRKDYRMYHGTDGLPGFPQHPHRGFETLTATLQGCVDHTDSLGNAGRYGGGDLQWMTAGSGVVHGENFPLIHDDKPNTMELFQIWLNLPAKSKMCDPAFVMHWRENIALAESDDKKTKAIVWAGSLLGVQGQQPPPSSYAGEEGADVAVWHLSMEPGAEFELPAAEGGSATNRALYFYEGAKLEVEGQKIDVQHRVVVDAGSAAKLRVPDGAGEKTHILILQGRPIGEPVAQRGPFVMNTQQEIMQTIMDYQRTQFGGWPWENDAVAFPKDKGRFELQNGTEAFPPPDTANRGQLKD
jgi:quercetin 2,3-dioxygenase